MSRYEVRFDSVEQMAEQFREWFKASGAGDDLWGGGVMLSITPGDMTEYRIGLQLPSLGLVGLSLYSPYQRAAIVPTGAVQDYLLDKLRIDERDRRYGGLLVILETVLGAL